jgi:hypothetical protein
MTDQRLHDLLHESVADATVPDLAEAAWRSATTTRRRRTAGVLAAATAVVVVVAATMTLSGGSDRRTPTGRPTTTITPAPVDADASYHGYPVWWSPSLAQEAALPQYPNSPLPATIDFSHPATPLDDDPVGAANAAFAIYSDGHLTAVDVLGSDGRLRRVRIGPSPTGPGPVKPMRDPEGNLRINAGTSMLSPSGDFLMFPQKHSIRLLTLATRKWSTIRTGSAPTWDATWISDSRIVLPDPRSPGEVGPIYTVDGPREGSAPPLRLSMRDLPLGSSRPYGRAWPGEDGGAQAFYPGARVPQPPALHLSPGQSDWIGVGGGRGGLLVIPSEPDRQKGCCQADTWIAPDTLVYDSSSTDGTRLIAWQLGTDHFWKVSQLTGIRLGQQYVVSSYAWL